MLHITELLLHPVRSRILHAVLDARPTGVRGAIERAYQQRLTKTSMSPEAISAMTNDDRRRGFAAAIATLVGECNAYADRDNANPLAGPVSYRQFALWLSDAEIYHEIHELDLLCLLGERATEVFTRAELHGKSMGWTEPIVVTAASYLLTG